MAIHEVYDALTSHFRYSTAHKFAQLSKQDECEAGEADVREETGIGMYKIISHTGRIHMF
jgi:hypothetical protein